MTFNTICIFWKHGELSDQGNIFVAFISADCNKWLWNYKIIKLTVFVRGRWGLMKICEVSGRGGVTKIKQVRTRRKRGSKFLSFYVNVIIECPPLTIQRYAFENNLNENETFIRKCSLHIALCFNL